MLRTIRQVGAWVSYRLIRGLWWFQRPIILGVRVLIADDDRILLVRHSYRNEWFLPGGSPNRGEPLKTTARREVREETGLDLESPQLLSLYSTLTRPVSNHVVIFVGQVAASQSPGAAHATSAEIETVRWVPAQRLPDDAAPQTQRAVDDWLHERRGICRVVGTPRTE
jgi:ADP-ribose pyrophosphatase YjhB (NUDIX family)